MPILSYFLVVGTALFGVLALVSNRLEPTPLPVTQTIGIPAPFKAPPDEVQSISAVNFGAEHPATNGQTPDVAPRQKRGSKSS
jgi:hypothetical protein